MELTRGKIIVIGFGVAMVVSMCQRANEPPKVVSEYDSMHYAAKQLCPKNIIAALKDPDSYKELKTDFGTVKGKPNHYALDVTYTATNSFGGRVKSTARCYMSNELGIYKIVKL